MRCERCGLDRDPGVRVDGRNYCLDCGPGEGMGDMIKRLGWNRSGDEHIRHMEEKIDELVDTVNSLARPVVPWAVQAMRWRSAAIAWQDEARSWAREAGADDEVIDSEFEKRLKANG